MPRIVNDGTRTRPVHRRRAGASINATTWSGRKFSSLL